MLTLKNYEATLKILFSLLTACNLLAGENTNEQGQLQVVLGPNTSGFQLKLTTTNKIFALGQPVEMTVSLKNISTNRTIVNVGDGYMNYSFKIIGPDGKMVQPTIYGKRLLHPTALYHQSIENLAPNESITAPIHLNALFAMTNLGQYVISASRESEGLKRASAGPLKIWITEPSKTNSLGVKKAIP